MSPSMPQATEDSIKAAVREASQKTQERLALYQKKQQERQKSAAAADTKTPEQVAAAEGKLTRLQALVNESKRLTAASTNKAVQAAMEEPDLSDITDIATTPTASDHAYSGEKGKKLAQIFQTLGNKQHQHQHSDMSASMNDMGGASSRRKQFGGTSSAGLLTSGNKSQDDTNNLYTSSYKAEMEESYRLEGLDNSANSLNRSSNNNSMDMDGSANSVESSAMASVQDVFRGKIGKKHKDKKEEEEVDDAETDDQKVPHYTEMDVDIDEDLSDDNDDDEEDKAKRKAKEEKKAAKKQHSEPPPQLLPDIPSLDDSFSKKESKQKQPKSTAVAVTDDEGDIDEDDYDDDNDVKEAAHSKPKRLKSPSRSKSPKKKPPEPPEWLPDIPSLDNDNSKDELEMDDLMIDDNDGGVDDFQTIEEDMNISISHMLSHDQKKQKVAEQLNMAQEDVDELMEEYYNQNSVSDFSHELKASLPVLEQILDDKSGKAKAHKKDKKKKSSKKNKKAASPSSDHVDDTYDVDIDEDETDTTEEHNNSLDPYDDDDMPELDPLETPKGATKNKVDTSKLKKWSNGLNSIAKSVPYDDAEHDEEDDDEREKKAFQKSHYQSLSRAFPLTGPSHQISHSASERRQRTTDDKLSGKDEGGLHVTRRRASISAGPPATKHESPDKKSDPLDAYPHDMSLHLSQLKLEILPDHASSRHNLDGPGSNNGKPAVQMHKSGLRRPSLPGGTTPAIPEESTSKRSEKSPKRSKSDESADTKKSSSTKKDKKKPKRSSKEGLTDESSKSTKSKRKSDRKDKKKGRKEKADMDWSKQSHRSSKTRKSSKKFSNMSEESERTDHTQDSIDKSLQVKEVQARRMDVSEISVGSLGDDNGADESGAGRHMRDLSGASNSTDDSSSKKHTRMGRSERTDRSRASRSRSQSVRRSRSQSVKRTQLRRQKTDSMADGSMRSSRRNNGLKTSNHSTGSDDDDDGKGVSRSESGRGSMPDASMRDASSRRRRGVSTRRSTQTDQLTAALEAMDVNDIKLVGGEKGDDEESEDGNLLGRSIYDPPRGKNKSSLAGLSDLPGDSKEGFDGDSSYSESVSSKQSKIGKFAKRMSRKLVGTKSSNQGSELDAMAAAVAVQQLSEEFNGDDSETAVDPEMLALAADFNEEEAMLEEEKKKKGVMSKIKKGVGKGLGFGKKKKDKEKDGVSVGSDEEPTELSHSGGGDDLPMNDGSARGFVQLEFNGNEAHIAKVGSEDGDDDDSAEPAQPRLRRAKSTRYNQRGRAENQRVQSLHAVLDASARDTMDGSGNEDASMQGSASNIRQRRSRRYDARKDDKAKPLGDESTKLSREGRRSKSTKERGEGKTKRSARRTKSAAVRASKGESPGFDWSNYKQ